MCRLDRQLLTFDIYIYIYNVYTYNGMVEISYNITYTCLPHLNTQYIVVLYISIMYLSHNVRRQVDFTVCLQAHV